MTEFDLIEPDRPRPKTHLSLSSTHLAGRFSQPVLQIWLGEERWDDRPSPEEIPGWRRLETCGDGPFSWQEGERALLWQGRPLFREQTPPFRRRPLDEELPGLSRRENDPLPEGSEESLIWCLSPSGESRLYGLGQRSGPLERTGLTCVNWTTDNASGHNRTTDPLYQAHPLLWGCSDGCWWAILLCHTGYSRFDLGRTTPGVLEIFTLAPSLCLQIHAADSPIELLRSLRQTLDDPHPPPLWAFGFHQSRWGYKEAGEVTRLIASFRERRLPLDAVHLDIDHMDCYRSFSFDKERFPEPEAQFNAWSDQGVRVVTIIDPGLKFDPSEAYGPVLEGLREGHFITSRSGAPVVGYCWPDEAVFPDFCRRKTRRWWAELARFYLDRGVAGLWIDMNEPAIFDRPFWSGKAKQQPMPLDTPWGEDGKRLDHARLRNLYGSYMAEATQAAWGEGRSRPWVLTRAAFTGAGRYAWSWMGDNTSWWEHLALSLPQLSSMSLVNSPFVGVDIGGFFGNCNGELYSAWIEASVIYPFMRAHSALGTALQHPWSFGPEVEETARRALELRYRLLPYIYAAAMHYLEGEAPPLRPMFFDRPDDRRFHYLEDQVMFGPHLMACPFVTRGQEQRLVVLPESGWYDFHSGRRLSGNTAVVTRTPGLLPLFCRPGAAIPMLERSVSSSDEAHGVDWTVRYFPAEEETTSRLYWDSGDGEGDEPLRVTLVNRHGRLSVTERQADRSGRKIRIETATSEGFQLGPPLDLHEL